MRKPALVVSDLDGTLIRSNTAAVEPGVLELVRRLIEGGIPFVPASGRQYPNVRALFDALPYELSAVCENGVVASVAGELVYRATLDFDLGVELVRCMLQREGCEVMVSGMQTYYIEPNRPAFERHLVEGCGFIIAHSDDLTCIDEPYGKISAYYPDGIGDDWRYWFDRFGERCSVTTSSDKWLDIMPNNVNKATALRVVLDRLGVDPADVIAFGDADNDVEMLKLVGCAIAKADGAPRVIAQSNYTTDNVAASLQSILDGPGFDW